MSTTKPNIELAEMLLAEIATTATTIDRLCYHLPEDLGAEALSVQIDVIRDMVSRIGWMADMGCNKLTGHARIKGDAEQWLVNPVYVRMLEKAAEAMEATA